MWQVAHSAVFMRWVGDLLQDMHDAVTELLHSVLCFGTGDADACENEKDEGDPRVNHRWPR
jgi:hypothetical protein